jgi:hypothetical protein
MLWSLLQDCQEWRCRLSGCKWTLSTVLSGTDQSIVVICIFPADRTHIPCRNGFQASALRLGIGTPKGTSFRSSSRLLQVQREYEDTPEQSLFHTLFLLLLTHLVDLVGPRLLLCYIWYLSIIRNVPENGSPGFANLLLVNDLIRTLACGGWVFVTSSDDLVIHNFAMIVYLLCTVLHVIGTIQSASQNLRTQKYRHRFAYSFLVVFVFMAYFFIQHNVYRIPGGKESDNDSS